MSKTGTAVNIEQRERPENQVPANQVPGAVCLAVTLASQTFTIVSVPQQGD
jgi:hypothetical protein